MPYVTETAEVTHQHVLLAVREGEFGREPDNNVLPPAALQPGRGSHGGLAIFRRNEAATRVAVAAPISVKTTRPSPRLAYCCRTGSRSRDDSDLRCERQRQASLVSSGGRRSIAEG